MNLMNWHSHWTFSIFSPNNNKRLTFIKQGIGVKENWTCLFCPVNLIIIIAGIELNEFVTHFFKIFFIEKKFPNHVVSMFFNTENVIHSFIQYICTLVVDDDFWIFQGAACASSADEKLVNKKKSKFCFVFLRLPLQWLDSFFRFSKRKFSFSNLDRK